MNARHGLDVHFEVPPNLSREWIDRTFYNLRLAVEKVEMPIFIYVIKGMPGLAGALCAGGYTCGTSQYATHTSADEYLLPHTFMLVQQQLSDRGGLYSLPEYCFKSMKTVRARESDLMVYRRDQLLDCYRPLSPLNYLNHPARVLYAGSHHHPQ